MNARPWQALPLLHPVVSRTIVINSGVVAWQEEGIVPTPHYMRSC